MSFISAQIISNMKFKIAPFFFCLIFLACASRRNPNTEEFMDAKIEEEYDYVFKEYELSSKRDYKQAFKKEGLFHHWAEIKKHFRPEVRLTPTHISENQIAIGASKLGGHPDIPASLSWPIDKDGGKMFFLAQVNLNEIDHNHIDQSIPNSGLIYFFIDEQSFCKYRFETADFKVIYYMGSQDLSRRENPQKHECLGRKNLPSCILELQNAYSLPSETPIFLEDWEYPHYHDLSTAPNRRSKILGYSDDIQGAMENSCEQEISGYANEKFSNLPDSIKNSIESRAKEWRLLFQLDSEVAALMSWQDSGKLYFWMKESDLASLDFENLVVIQQGH